jgi:hypothetical protein
MSDHFLSRILQMHVYDKSQFPLRNLFVLQINTNYKFKFLFQHKKPRSTASDISQGHKMTLFTIFIYQKII